MTPGFRRDAQQRVDRIRAFREEIAELEGAGVLSLTPEQRAAVEQHHASLIADLTSRFDVDATESQKRVSWGMRIASLLGGIALCVALVLFFQRIWGVIPVAAQVVILVSMPLLLLPAIEFAARREKTLYYAGLLMLVAIAAFITNLSALGSIFNVQPSAGALLIWGAFSLTLAYQYGLRLPLAAGLVLTGGFVAANLASWCGVYWQDFLEVPETVIAVGLLVVAAPLMVRARARDEFPAVYRLVGLLAVFVALLSLSVVGDLSFLPFSNKKIESAYQAAGLLAGGLAIWVGIRAAQRETVNIGAVAFTVFLLVRLHDWWWNWMPKYLFFLIIGLISLTLLALFRKIRARKFEGAAP